MSRKVLYDVYKGDKLLSEKITKKEVAEKYNIEETRFVRFLVFDEETIEIDGITIMRVGMRKGFSGNTDKHDPLWIENFDKEWKLACERLRGVAKC